MNRDVLIARQTARGVHVEVTVVVQPGTDAREVYGAISRAADEARDLYREECPGQLMLTFERDG